MPETYFIRHGSALDVDAKTIDALWTEGRVAIHYPRDKSGNCADADSQSLDPGDYEGHAKSALRRLLDLAKSGGYVFATYRGKPGGKIGYVKPGSEVELFRGSWGNKNKRQGQEAKLKSVSLSQFRNLSAEEAISLISVQPRQGTFCRWRNVGPRVVALVDGVQAINLGCLTPDLQEVMCMEYLRTVDAARRGLPTLRYTLMPVGRTMKDIDILGIAESGKIISAQVTFKDLDPAGGKLRKLDPYRSNGNETIYFCQCDEPATIHGHFVFPLRTVFDDFCLRSETGRDWLRLAAGI